MSEKENKPRFITGEVVEQQDLIIPKDQEKKEEEDEKNESDFRKKI